LTPGSCSECLFDGVDKAYHGDDVVATFIEVHEACLYKFTVTNDSTTGTWEIIPYSAYDSGISSLLVTFSLSGETWVADKTFAEITAAIADGAYVYAKAADNTYYTVSECDPRPNDGWITFTSAGYPILGFTLWHDEDVDTFDYLFATETWVQQQGYLKQHQSLAAYQTKSITDAGGYFTSDTVEGALQEIGAELAGINTLIGSGVIT
jgi:hypothetical protein